MQGRLRRYLIGAVLAVFAAGASGLSDTLLLAAETAMACCKTVSQCPAHAPHATAARGRATRHDALPRCCALAPDSSDPRPPVSTAAQTGTVLLAQPLVTAAPRLIPVRVRPAPRSGPLRRHAVPPHLLFSVFLV